MALCSAPAVAPDPANPVMLQCTPPSGGPWSTCQLTLCESQLTRRRLLRSVSCTDVSCPFVSGVANCDLTGKVEQDIPYSINSTAVKSDGTRKSQTGSQSQYTLPLFP